jgi:hypothetical protein
VNAAPQAAAALDAAAVVPEGGGDDALANPAPAAAPSAVELAALVQALRGGDTAAQLTAAKAVSRLAKKLEERKEEFVRFCDALAENGTVAALLQLLSSCSPDTRRAAASASTLTWLTAKNPACRRAVLAAGGIKLLLRIVHADVSCARKATLSVIIVFRNCMAAVAAQDFFAADAKLNRQVVEVLQGDRKDAFIVARLLEALRFYVARGATARDALRREHCLPVLAALLLEPQGKSWREPLSVVIVSFQNADRRTSEAMHAEMYDAGIYAACVGTLAAATSSADPSDVCALKNVTLILLTAFESDALRPLLLQYILGQPGMLAGVAHAARMCTQTEDTEIFVELLMLLQADEWLHAAPGLWLLDAHFAASAVMQLRDADAALAGLFAADWKRSAACLKALATPLPHQALPAVVSLACLAGENAHFRTLLASETRLQILCDALVAAAARRCSEAADDAKPAAAADVSQQPSLWWQLRVFRHAIKSAVGAARLTAAAPVAAPPEMIADD